MAKTSSSARRTARAAQSVRRSRMVFTRHNYVLLVIGVVLVVVGYVIMRIENEVDGFISLYIAPLLILGGYLEVTYAILWRPKSEAAETSAQAAAP